MERKGNGKEIATGAVFVLALAGLAIGSLCAPEREVSELENRRLAAMPKFAVSAFESGAWAADLQEYAQDHIVGRDLWIDLSSRVNTEIFRQTEQGGILLGDEGWMFSKPPAADPAAEGRFAKNVSAVAEFAGRYGERVTFIPVPSSALVYEERVPAGALRLDENALLDRAIGAAEGLCGVIDLRGPFAEAREAVQLYYKTDHHWTTDGAYLAYLAYCGQKGLTPADLSRRARREVPGFLGTHYMASRWHRAEADTLAYYDWDQTETVFEINGEDQFTPVRQTGLMAEEKLAGADKYGAFLGGNGGYVELTGSGTGKVLVIKDSYANCFVPFLTENYETVGVIDFRNFPYGPDALIAERGYEEIIVLYSFSNFMEDSHLVYLNRPGTSRRGG